MSELSEYVMPIGTHRGKTLEDIWQEDSDYLYYIVKEFRDGDEVKDKVEEFLEEQG